MNSYLYAIKNLKIKPWIKYWLIKQTEFKDVLSDILEGTSFYLTDSLNMKFKMFKIYGRTTQESDPTPENPVPIKNTGDNGNVNEKIQNENLLSTQNIDTTIARVTYKSQNDGTILANGTKYGGNYSNFTNNTVTLETDTYSSRIFLLDGTIKKDGNDYKPEIYLINQDDNTKSYSISEIGNPGRTKNIEAGTYFIRIALWNDNIIFTNAKIGFMLVKGSIIPDEFVPHSEQNISFPLGEGQKLMEGDYLADDGIHSLWNEDTVNGTTSTFIDAKTNGAYYCNQKVSGNLTGQTITFDTSVINAIVQYELAQEQVIPYTEEQKTAWEQIKKARTYKNVTHISSEDETPAELKIQYYKEG